MRLSSLFALSSLSLLGSIALTGCSGAISSAIFPESSAEISPGPLQGSNYGGHAPIAGSHLFLLEATASSAGYGGQATSLLSSSVAGAAEDLTGTPTTNPTYGMYFVPTAADGTFNITDDYTCSSGDPVYIYSQGGSPNSSVSTTTQVTQAVVADSGTEGYQTVTMTANQNFVAGQPITIYDFPQGMLASDSVLSAGLSATQFEIIIPTGIVEDGIYTGATVNGVTATGFAGNNPQVVNLAMLGLCPGTTGEFANTLSYIYMNEVSTAAMAYAMAGFATTPTTGVTQNATQIGAPATTQALLGLQNAALNANQLYNIQGTAGTNTGDGSDFHVARSTTPAGNGIVPQAMLDTIGNILADCVDSANTYNPYSYDLSGTQSTQCSTLFKQASSTGDTTGTPARDTATAAFNIAHLPAGSSANSTTFMTDLYALQGTTFPFAPNLTEQPNDFTVAIQYPLSSNPAVNGAESIGVDASGNIWMNSYGNKKIFEMSPLGVVGYQSEAATIPYGYISVDPSGNIWTGCNFTTCNETEFTVVMSGGIQAVSGATYDGPYGNDGSYDPYITITDSSGNAYIGTAPTGGETQWGIVKLNSSGENVDYNGNIDGSTPLNATPFPAKYEIAHGAVENANTNTNNKGSSDGGEDIWFTTENYDGAAGWAIGRFDPNTGAATSGFPIYIANAATPNSPEEPGIDSASNLWVAYQNYDSTGGGVVEVSTMGNVTTATGGKLSNPFGVAIDGLGNVWVADRATGSGTSSILEYDNATAAAISPSTNYQLGGRVSHPLNLAVDPSGVLWITSYDSSQVVEMLGQAAPATTPLSYASGVNQLGVRP